jgi:hypothetical protein
MIERMGIDLATYTDRLLHVEPEHDEKPILSFDLRDAIGPHACAYAKARYGTDHSSARLANLLPAKALDRLSVDQIAKMRHSSTTMMKDCVEDKFRNEPRFRIIEKIRSSMWRWGMLRCGWNEMVDTYNSIRAFSFDVPDFDIRFDYTMGVNAIGSSEYSRTFLDGALGYLVYYKGQHVMTLGFSVVAGYRVLITQVQLKSRRGNRWMFKFPKNRLEYIVGRFIKAFSHHQVLVVDGGDVANENISHYREGVLADDRMIARYEETLSRMTILGSECDRTRETLSEYVEHRKGLLEKIAHLTADVDRLRAFYAASGRHKQYRRKGVLDIKNQRHYVVASTYHLHRP